MGMGDKLNHENSAFVVCRACEKYFFLYDIAEHQEKEHPNYEWNPKDDPYRKFYYLTNNEVAWTLNRLQEIRKATNALRLLVL
jgi:hypothetical protein